jgi:hypothetical protein
MTKYGRQWEKFEAPNSKSEARGVAPSSSFGFRVSDFGFRACPCRSSVVHLGDAGMFHHRQGLSLGLEARDHLLRIHTGLDDLESNLPAHGLRLLGQVDDAHAPFADDFQQLVRPDAGADGHRVGGKSDGTQYHRGMLQEGAGPVVIGEKAFDLGPQFGVAAAGLRDESPALRGGDLDGLRQNVLDARNGLFHGYELRCGISL